MCITFESIFNRGACSNSFCLIKLIMTLKNLKFWLVIPWQLRHFKWASLRKTKFNSIDWFLVKALASYFISYSFRSCCDWAKFGSFFSTLMLFLDRQWKFATEIIAQISVAIVSVACLHWHPMLRLFLGRRNNLQDEVKVWIRSALSAIAIDWDQFNNLTTLVSWSSYWIGIGSFLFSLSSHFFRSFIKLADSHEPDHSAELKVMCAGQWSLKPSLLVKHSAAFSWIRSTLELARNSKSLL